MKKVNNIEKNILSYIESKVDILFIIAISVAALLVRWIFKDYSSKDFEVFLFKWCSFLEENGGFKAISSVNSDYNAIYLYFLAFFTYIPGRYIVKIKALSIIFDYIAAAGSYLIVSEVLKNNINKKMISALAYSAVLFLPTVIMNGAVWGQCDVIYTAFILFSLYCILKNKNISAFVLYGIALTFKLQAVLLLPMYIILYIKNKNFSILNFLLIPAVNFVLYIPALCMGKTLSSIFDAYISQTGEYKELVLNYPNIYKLLPSSSEKIGQVGMIVTIFLLGAISFIIISSKEKIEEAEVVGLSSLIILTAVYFLPHMHERYAFCGEVLAVIYYLLKRKKIFIPTVLILDISIFYFNFLKDGVYIDPVITALIQLGIILLMFNDIIGDLFANKFIFNKMSNQDDECIVDLEKGISIK